MQPVIALVGRPNVGKSTLFNRLTRSRDALVANFPGLTRDRKYGQSALPEYSFVVIDTGGVVGDEMGIDAEMAAQSSSAAEEADIILFIVDAREGLLSADHILADRLRRQNKSVKLILNKCDGVDADVAKADFYRLGMGEPLAIAAAHGRGVSKMLDVVFQNFPAAHKKDSWRMDVEDTFDLPECAEAIAESEESAPEGDSYSDRVRIAVIGRPNVGKSTLVNRILGEDRVIVFDQAGTTRDSIYIPYERDGQLYTLIDTAGVRRRGKIKETVEKFSVIKTLQAIKDAHVVLFMIDAREGLSDQDLHLISFALEAGRALVIAVNKWDGLTESNRQAVKNDLEHRLGFIDYVKVHFISALHGTGVGSLYKPVQEAFRAATTRWSASRLTRILNDATINHQPPLVNGRRIKLRYCHLGGLNPPRLVIHGNQTQQVPASYRRYLENIYRKVLKIVGSPVKIEFKANENPYSGNKNQLTERQLKKRKRMITHIKRTGKKRSSAYGA